jgi:hypothetical protein
MRDDWTDEVLEETPARVTKFLSGMGAEPVVRTLLEGAGMSDHDIVEGRTLLLACLANPSPAAADTDTDSARKQREAVAAIDAWDEPNFARYRAALDRHVPTVGAVLFHDLAASTGPASVQGVATLLLRLDGLDHTARGAKAPKASDAVLTAAAAFEAVPAKDRKAAAELLLKRGLDATTRETLTSLVETALGPTASLDAAPAADAERNTKRRDALREARAWFEEWSTCARAVVKKRAHLIRLGLAKRKAPTKKTKTPATPEATK